MIEKSYSSWSKSIVVLQLILMVYFNCDAQQFEWETTFDFLSSQSKVQGLHPDEATGDVYMIASENEVSPADGILIKVNDFGDTVWTVDLSLGIDTPFFADFRTAVIYRENIVYVAGATLYNEGMTLVKVGAENGVILFRANFTVFDRPNVIPREMRMHEDSTLYVFSDAMNPFKTGDEGAANKFTVHSINKSGALNWYRVYDALDSSVQNASSMDFYPEGILLNGYLSSPEVDGCGTCILAQKIRHTGEVIQREQLMERDLASDTLVLTSNGNAVYTTSNEFVFTGHELISGTPTPVFLLKTDTSFNVQWLSRIQIGGTFSSRVVEVNNGNLIVITLDNLEDDILLYTFSPQGEKLDSVSVTSAIGEFGHIRDIYLTQDSCLYIGGITAKGDHAYIGKISGVGIPATVSGIKSFTFDQIRSTINFYPNPTQDYLNINPQQSGMLQVYDASGIVVREEQVDSDTQWLVSDWPSGVYAYRFITKGFTQGGSLVKE